MNMQTLAQAGPGLGKAQGCFSVGFNLPADSGEYPRRPCALNWEGQTLESDRLGLTPGPAASKLWDFEQVPYPLWTCFLICVMDMTMEPTMQGYCED